MVTGTKSRPAKTKTKQSEIGEIPLDWCVSTVGDVADVKTGPFGSVLHERDYVTHGTPIITVEHLSERGIVHENLPMVSDSDKKRLSSYSLKTNDIVFSRVGSVDRNSLISTRENGWLFSGRLLRVRVIDKETNPQFLSYHFHQECFKRRVREVAVGQTMASINTKILRNILVALPKAKAEQSAIADIISDADCLIDTLDKLIAKKRAIMQGAMQELLTGRRRLAGYNAPWTVTCLDDVIEKIVGGGTPSRANPSYWGEGIPWVTVKDFATFDPHRTQESVTLVGLKNSSSHLIPRNTLIVATRIALGKAVIYDIDVCINQDLKALFLKPHISTKILYYWFQHFGKSIENLGGGSTVKGLTLSELRRITINLPRIEEQEAIASVFEEMVTEISAMTMQLNKCQELRTGIMQALLTGRIRLPSK